MDVLMYRFKWRIFPPFLVGIVLFNSVAIAQEPASAQQATFTVTSTADAGPRTLRQALLDANATPNSGGPDLITFDIAGSGMHTIQLGSSLPAITEAVFIDGTTQSGAECGNSFVSRNLLIEIDGSAVAGAGLTLASAGSTIKGLILNRFPYSSDGSIRALHITGNGSDGNRVVCSFFGTDDTGVPGLAASIIIDEGSSENVIGGTTGGEGNLFTGAGRVGVYIIGAGTDNNRVEGNYFGLMSTGSQVNGLTLGLGIKDGASGNVIGGTIPGARNVFADNLTAIHVQSPTTSRNRISGNYIGTDPTGTQCLGDSYLGIILNNAGPNLIGGTESGAGNVIACHRSDPFYIENTNSTTIQGNLIGTNASGTQALANRSAGIWVDTGSSDTVIGGTVPGARNIISGNDNPGINIYGSRTVVQGNYIGTDITGSVAIGNRLGGIVVIGGQDNIIGGTTPGAANVISGSVLSEGIRLWVGAKGNIIQGNLIGVNATGTAPLGNNFGVNIVAGSANTIGGTSEGAGNIIGGNLAAGILIQFEDASDNIVQGNFIGTDAMGRNLRNLEYGIWIAGSATDNLIGGSADGAGNVIAFNGNTGVSLYASDNLRNRIQGNQIYENGGLGIDLGGDGVTPNDGGDADEGANRLQNAPEFTEAAQTDDGVAISLFVDTATSSASYPLSIEFFRADDSGEEGQVLLGRTNYSSVDYTACGTAPCELTVEIVTDITLPAQIVATATDAAGNTSEFSEAISVLSGEEINATKTDAVLNEHPDGVARLGDEIAYTIEITNTSAADATAVVFNDNPDANTQLVAGTVTTSQGTVTTGNTSGDEEAAVALGTIASTATATIQFRVRVNDDVSAAVEKITNQGTVDGSNFEEIVTDDPDVGGGEDVTSTPLEVPAVLTATKEAILQQDQDDDGRADSGDIIEYTIELISTNGVARDVIFRDTLDAYTTLIAGSVLTSVGDPVIVGNTPGDTTVVVEAGTLEGENSVIIQFKAAVNEGLPAGTTHLRNQGWFTGENVDNVPTDDPTTSPVGDATLLVADDGTGTATTPEEEVVKHLQLLPNYPNPFMGETVIPFTLPQATHLTLTVFDLHGREVLKLLDRHLPAGQHVVKWQPQSSPAGIYFVRLQTDSGQRSYKIALMK